MPTNVCAPQPAADARRFDPARSRDELKSWTIEVFQHLDFEEAYHQQRLGSCGMPTSEVAVETLLVGLFQDGKDLLHRAESFLRLAIDRREQGELSQVIICENHALMEWLFYRKDARKQYQAAVQSSELIFNHPSRTPRKPVVQRSLPAYLAAREHEKLLQRFEATGLRVPANLRRIRGQGTMAYVLAKQRLGIAYDQGTVADALDVFLRRSVPKWLGHSQFTTAARWMKIAHWQPEDDPIATLLRCYDYLSGLKPPAYAAVPRGRPATRQAE